MADPKQQLMSQVRQQAALANARQLVEVRFHHLMSITSALTRHLCAEIERTLLRTLRSQNRDLSQLLRADLLHTLHGEVHGSMEHSIAAVFRARAKECQQ